MRAPAAPPRLVPVAADSDDQRDGRGDVPNQLLEIRLEVRATEAELGESMDTLIARADEALVEWLDLNGWVTWLRLSYGLPPAVVPPLWHRHDELIWELSALHAARVNAYDPEASPSAPLAWHREFRECQQRLREWVSLSGTRLDRDRPTRQTARSSGKGGSPRSPPWAGSPPTTTSRTESSRERGCRRSFAALRSSSESTASESATSSMRETETCT